MGTRVSRAIPNTLKTAVINVSASAGVDAALIAAVPTKKLRIWSCMLTLSTSTTIVFKDGTTALTGPMSTTLVQVDAPKPSPHGGFPWKECSTNTAFNINCAGNVTVAGEIVYSDADND